MTGLFPMCAATLALLGCQQESTNPAEHAAAASDREYALEVQKLKAGPAESFPENLAALDAKFGFPAAQTGTAAPAGDAAPLEKTARSFVTGGEGRCMPLMKFVRRLDPGDRVKFDVGSLISSDVGTSDPVAMIIRLKNPEFISIGLLPNLGTVAFDILAWNDDESRGNLSAVLDYTVKPNEGGYYMMMAYPFENASSNRIVSLSLDVTRVNCRICNDDVTVQAQTLGGLVFPFKGGNEFLATQMTGEGNPRIYVSLNSLGSGVTNGNSSSTTLNARAYPYAVTAAQGLLEGNTVIIDNDVGGLHWFKYWQFKP